MSNLVGSIEIIWFIVFTYIVITFIMFNIITSIVTQAINVTIEKVKEEQKGRKSVISDGIIGKFLHKLGI